MRRLGIAILSLVALAAAARPALGATDGGLSCVTSDDCGAPTAYCQPDQHTCVACVGDKNCSDGKVCSPVTWQCVTCRNDSDCFPGKPYCDGENGCVECKTNANCAGSGTTCKAGKCGTCGDGICGPHEQLVTYDSISQPSDDVYCPDDCAKACPDATLELGKSTTLRIGTRDLFNLSSCVPGAGPDSTATFTAPNDGAYYFTARGPNDGALAVTVLDGTCNGDSVNGCSIGEGRHVHRATMTAGQVVTIVVESTDPGTYVVAALDDFPDCEGQGPGCGEPPPPPVEDAGPEGATTAVCESNVESRGEQACAGVHCACDSCPATYDDCAVVPGCRDVVACFAAHECTGTDCYASGECRTLIDSKGGVSGSAFKTAAALQSCKARYGCELPCASNDVPDAGKGPIAGDLCEPGREVACACEGGTGTKTCNGAGTAFLACDCKSTTVENDAKSSCDCRIGSRSEPGDVLVIASGLGLVLTMRRRGAKRELRNGRVA